MLAPGQPRAAQPPAPTGPRTALRWGLAVAACLVAVSLLHYLTPVTAHAHKLHDIYDRLYYVPIVMAAFAFGARGAIGAGLAATALYVPHILLQWGHSAHGAQPMARNAVEDGALAPLRAGRGRRTHVTVGIRFEEGRSGERTRPSVDGQAASG